MNSFILRSELCTPQNPPCTELIPLSTSSNLHTPTPPFKHPLHQLPHTITRIILLSSHSPIRKPYLPTLQIRFRRSIKECFGDDRLFLFREGGIGVVGRRVLCLGLVLNDGESGEAGGALFGGACESTEEGAVAGWAGWHFG